MLALSAIDVHQARVDADQLTGAVLPALVGHGEMLADVFRAIDRLEVTCLTGCSPPTAWLHFVMFAVNVF